LIGGCDPCHVFGLVHERAVVVGVDERVVDEVGDFFDLLIGFGLVPGALELADLDFVGGGGFFLGERRRREDQGDRQEDETVHLCRDLCVEFWWMLARSWARSLGDTGCVH
jgi:hypothetical protein